MALFQYFYTIIQSNAFGLEKITHRYPEPGHSFLPCDRCFGLMEKNKRKMERVFIPQTYQNMVKETSSDKFNVINITQNDIYNFSEYLKPNFKKYITSSHKERFTVMAYRLMEYLKDGLYCQTIVNSTLKEHFILQKSGTDLKYPLEHLPLLYSMKLKLKEAKLKDVQDLASKYVPSEFIWFYEQLEGDVQNNENVPTSDNEY